MKLNGMKIGIKHKPFIIAEISANHNNDISTVFKLLEAAKECNVDAVKVQTYTADSLTIKSDRPEFKINNEKSLWHGRTLYELYSEGSMPYDWYPAIFEFAKNLELTLFSSPFDEHAVDFLENFKVQAYKVASPEIIHLPLIKKIAETKKPVIMSTGMASLEEIIQATNEIRKKNIKDFALLQCISSYPANPYNFNLRNIELLRQIFNCEVGLSDHSLGNGVACAAVALGATIIEKHFILNRDDGGLDAKFSLEPKEMKSLVNETLNAWQASQGVNLGPSPDEQISMMYRRSIYVTSDLKSGDYIKKDHLKIIRPSNGLKPINFNKILGRKVKTDILAGTPLTFDLIK